MQESGCTGYGGCQCFSRLLGRLRNILHAIEWHGHLMPTHDIKFNKI